MAQCLSIVKELPETEKGNKGGEGRTDLEGLRDRLGKYLLRIPDQVFAKIF